ncbi:MAG TPA: DinB family protein [Patescibacteria group bacterium]|nr:DinB family protein [Patescibacteria group bacterium]
MINLDTKISVNAAQKQEVLAEIVKTQDRLIQAISAFKNEQVNLVPFEGSWTAAQVADHLLKSSGLVEILRGNVEETHRSPDEKIATLKAIFLDFTRTMESPEFIIPTDKPLEKEFLLQSFKTRFSTIINAAETLDLSPTCLDFELPGIGKFTRLEWLYFFAYHFQRHTHQLENIFRKL